MQRSLSMCQASYAIFPSDPQRKSIKSDCKCVSHIEIEIIFLKAACPKSPKPLPTSRICVFPISKNITRHPVLFIQIVVCNYLLSKHHDICRLFQIVLFVCLFVCLLFISMAVCKTSSTILNSICRRHADV